MIRYCGGFLNAMDEANEGAPVFAKVTFDDDNDDSDGDCSDEVLVIQGFWW